MTRLSVSDRALFGERAEEVADARDAMARWDAAFRPPHPLGKHPEMWAEASDLGRSRRLPSGWWLIPAALMGLVPWVALVIWVS